jgi:hypothetical protein
VGYGAIRGTHGRPELIARIVRTDTTSERYIVIKLFYYGHGQKSNRGERAYAVRGTKAIMIRAEGEGISKPLLPLSFPPESN